MVDGSGRAHPLIVSLSLSLLQGLKLPLPQGDVRDQKAGILLELNQAVDSAEDTHLVFFPKPIKEFSRMVLKCCLVCQGLSRDYLPHPLIISGAQCLGWVFVNSWCGAL